MREPYPLQWPPGLKRSTSRGFPKFSSQFSQNRDSVIQQIKRRGGSQIVITSDLPVRLDGLPYASSGCADPGIAVWFVKGGKEHVIACDHWARIADNLRAIDKSLEALRGLDRWGCEQIAEQAFAGFAALPAAAGDGAPPELAVKPWREVLGGHFPHELDAADTLVLAKSRYRTRIAAAHPDRGGDPQIAAELGAAIAAAEAELSPPAVTP